MRALDRLCAAAVAACVFATGVCLTAAPSLAREGSSNVVASQMLKDARGYAAAREWSVAESLWSAIISRFPGTTAAREANRAIAEARAHRALMAQTRSRLGGPPGAGQSATRGWITRTPSVGLAEAENGTGTGWATMILPRRSLQDSFRTEIGDRVFFAAFSSALGQRGQALLAAQIGWLKDRPDVFVTIEAHADEPGVGADNTRMANARGSAIKRYLIANGIVETRIRVVSFGKTQPIALCKTPACRAQNRRVVLKVAEAARTPR
ncbi:MAG: OmpA family protein [Pseudomonadota bacterium]